ncbi:uncharacterized protein LY79DRAFT_583766 [Colletotrichum navitas]|uniref:Uncharacterized protein n=1 Tax=Colletotrichum navitas TaxID=681940 RepID=A0AAD8PN79_9PEZI|nr:uncharacterized protein LY79DRAFT_583766 [Colletotrichum navitas]KAK1573217.1 hypothetical protein LY79DRAFT_583766 [Colletotrichum navitas]
MRSDPDYTPGFRYWGTYWHGDRGLQVDTCGFNDYTQIVKYTTEYDGFCSTGITRQKYKRTEVYEGVPFLPTVLSIKVPFGFSEEFRTCYYTCGPTTITATITQPATEP